MHAFRDSQDFGHLVQLVLCELLSFILDLLYNMQILDVARNVMPVAQRRGILNDHLGLTNQSAQYVGTFYDCGSLESWQVARPRFAYEVVSHTHLSGLRITGSAASRGHSHHFSNSASFQHGDSVSGLYLP